MSNTNAKRANTQALTKLTPAERTAKLLAYRGQTHNWTQGTRFPSKTIPIAGTRFATS